MSGATNSAAIRLLNEGSIPPADPATGLGMRRDD
jgi:hypothetical protein